MIFRLDKEKDSLIETAYDLGTKKLNSFYGFNWKKNKIEILIVKDRKTIDMLMGKKTPSWIVGWTNGTCIFILDKKNYEKESCHKYSNKEYLSLILHEMSHIYFGFKSNFNNAPNWLEEGVCNYISDQNKPKKFPKKFKTFLNFYENHNKGIYRESGFFIELLVKKFGKAKLMKLIKSLETCTSKQKFDNCFKKIYGFNLNYEKVNKLLLSI